MALFSIPAKYAPNPETRMKTKGFNMEKFTFWTFQDRIFPNVEGYSAGLQFPFSFA